MLFFFTYLTGNTKLQHQLTDAFFLHINVPLFRVFSSLQPPFPIWTAKEPKGMENPWFQFKRKHMTVTNFSHMSGKLHKKCLKSLCWLPLWDMCRKHTRDVQMCILCHAAFIAIGTYTVFVISYITENVIKIQDPTIPVLQSMHLYPVVWILHKRRK